MQTTYADSWSDISQPCDIDLWVMKGRSAWPICHSLLPFILKTTWYMNIILWDDSTFVLKVNVCQRDLYFMVQWFYFISWRVFDVWMSYFWIMSRCDGMFNLKINVGHCEVTVSMTYILQSFACYIEDYLIYEHHTLGWLDVWPKSKCRSMWPIFHGSVILPYILKTIWCTIVILCDNESVWCEPKNIRSQWPSFLWSNDFALYLE